jgi:hypothetical protein
MTLKQVWKIEDQMTNPAVSFIYVTLLSVVWAVWDRVWG